MTAAAFTSPQPALGCNYWHRGTNLQCRGDGYLWDADDDGFDPDEEDHPCPQCNTQAYLRRAKDDAESCSFGSVNGRCYTGESLWLSAIEVALAANGEAAEAALKVIGKVVALKPHPTDKASFLEVVFTY